MTTNPMRILVVEDDRLLRVTLRQVLSRMGHEVILAHDAASALAAARRFEGNIDLLLSDMVLLDASGAKIASTLVREWPDIVVLFMSAYPSDMLVQQGHIAPGTSTLEKPFNEEALARGVNAALQSKRLRGVATGD